MQQTIGNMTLDELKGFIQQVISEQRIIPHHAPYRLAPSSDEWWQGLVENMRSQKLESPSPLDILREEREKWYR
jgi:hypothetical protein